MQTRPFRQTRWRLASWYTVIMGFILSLCGFGIYRVMIYAHLVAIDQELQSITKTLHNSIEPKLKQPARLEPIVQQLLPDICSAEFSCPIQTIYRQEYHTSV